MIVYIFDAPNLRILYTPLLNVSFDIPYYPISFHTKTLNIITNHKNHDGLTSLPHH